MSLIQPNPIQQQTQNILSNIATTNSLMTNNNNNNNNNNNINPINNLNSVTSSIYNASPRGSATTNSGPPSAVRMKKRKRRKKKKEKEKFYVCFKMSCF